MSNATFPSLPGLQWDVKRKPRFKTLVSEAANGYTVRVPMVVDPLWSFECSFEFLRDDGSDELNQLLGFFLARKGAFDSFLLDLGALTHNQADSTVYDQPLDVDVNLCAPLVRTLGRSGYDEAIYALNGVPEVKRAGTPLAAGTDYTLYTPAQVGLGILNANNLSYSGYVARMATSAGEVTADLGFYYRVRFAQDEQEFDLFSYLLYEAQQVQLVTARE